MQGFNGFPRKGMLLSIPAVFFSELLPAIDHLGEMKVTLYCIWAMQRQEGDHRYVRFSEVLADKRFTKTLDSNPEQREARLQEAFERAVVRGTLLCVRLDMPSGSDEFYFMNSDKGRWSIQLIERGNWLPENSRRPIELAIDRPNIFRLYEQNIGTLTPIIADQLKDLLEDYPVEQIEEAIQLAVEQEARSLNYVISILKRQAKEGKGRHEVAGRSAEQQPQYGHLKEDYSDIIES
jgi:DnaD/phage-associated family protein